MEKLWTAIAFACRLDEDEPTGAWHRRHGELQRRAEVLQSLQLDALRFVDERTGTDLKVGLLDASRWQNGRARTQSGAPFVPNVPCEEIHTAPDPQRVEGVAVASRPLGIGDPVLEGVRAEFVGGVAHLVDPDERLARALSVPGGLRLGEVALVDGESRVGQAGEVFGDTLLDENAACHIAFGCPIPGSYGPGADGTVNASPVHLDLVIGTPTTSVTGITKDGQEISLLRQGAWQLGKGEGWNDPARIDRIIDALAIAWVARGEQRLGQLFRNAVPVLGDFELETVTDERVCRALESQATAVARGRTRSAADVANQERLIVALRDRWQAEPELRLGQLLRRIARGGGQYGDAGVALMSDEGWLFGLRR